MLDRTRRQVRRTEKLGRSRSVEYRAIDMSSDGGVEPSETIPIDR
jgi:hypothetical protein